MNAITPTHTRPEQRKARINLADLDLDDTSLSCRPVQRAWAQDLTAALQSDGRLDPILCWQDVKRPEARPVILDGRHRAAAYRALKRTTGLPAVILKCDRATAFMVAAEVHRKGKLMPSRIEVVDFAYRMVREVGPARTAAEIASASGVSKRTVERMRTTWRAMQREGIEPTGSWYRDLKGGPDREPGEMPSESELSAAAEAIAKELLDVLDKRRKDMPTWCGEVRLMALARALGDQGVHELHAWTFGGDPEWKGMREEGWTEDEDVEEVPF